MNDSRRFRVQSVDTQDELAANLTDGRTYCLCAGFRLATTRLLFLNDSFSEDGAQEYAVYDELTGKQIESITAIWMTKENLDAFITKTLAALPEAAAPVASTLPSLNHGKQPCRHCA